MKEADRDILLDLWQWCLQSKEGFQDRQVALVRGHEKHCCVA
jgi:hypothetical protein